MHCAEEMPLAFWVRFPQAGSPAGSPPPRQGQLPGRASHPTDTDASRTGTVARTRRAETGELSEADAIRLAQKGDAAAFEQLYRLHSRRVYALCLRMVGNTAEAEDLAQEAFLQLFRKIHTFRGESAFSTWLHRLAVNVVLMKLRKKTLPETSLEETTEPARFLGGTAPGKSA